MRGRPAHVDPKVSNRLREIRLERGLTLDQMGAQIGVTGKTVQRWERGRRELRPNQAKQIAKALGIDMAELYRQTTPSPLKAEILDLVERLTQQDLEYALRMLRGLEREHQPANDTPPLKRKAS